MDGSLRPGDTVRNSEGSVRKHDAGSLPLVRLRDLTAR